jgi:salicylate hydroxylase
LAAEKGDIPKAFEEYRKKRVHRTARVQIQSRLIGDHIYHPAGGHAALRNAVMRAMTAKDYYDSLQWLYGGSGLAEGSSACR